MTARGTLTRREMVLLRIRDEDGVEGLGEAVPLCLRGGRDDRARWCGSSEAFEPSWQLGEDVAGACEGLSLPALCALTTACSTSRRSARATRLSTRRCGATRRW